MRSVSYDRLEKNVKNCFFESRSLLYGLDIMQSTDRTLVEFEQVAERNDLEHLIVYLSVAKILLEEQFFDEELHEDLLKHYREGTALGFKEDLQHEEYVRLVSDLENVLNTWK